MLDIVFKKVIEMWLYDMKVFSKWWLYAPLLVPAIGYFMFFIMKWVTITAPLWLPLSLIGGSFRRTASITVKKVLNRK